MAARYFCGVHSLANCCSYVGIDDINLHSSKRGSSCQLTLPGKDAFECSVNSHVITFLFILPPNTESFSYFLDHKDSL